MNSAAAERAAVWVRGEAGELRRETIHSMLRRLEGWDYRQPWIYQITLVCADRRAEPFGRIVVRERGGSRWLSLAEARVAKPAPDAIEAKTVLTPLGEEVFALFRRFAEFTPEIKPLCCQIMPEHLHFIVQVVREMKRPLGNAIGGFKTGCEKLYRKLSLSERDEGAAGGAAAAAGGAARGEGRLFADGFQDTILFHAGQLGNMFGYLGDNPRRRAIKALYPDLFRVVDEIAIPLRLSPREQNVAAARESAACESTASRQVPRATARGWFSSLGNRFLLDRPLAQVQVSRRDFGYRREPKPGGGLKICRDAKGEPIADFATPLFFERKAALFAAAKHGAALLSPCVSDGERQIAREALAAGLPLVTLHNKGFSRLQKPSGRHFDACANGRLLMLAPAAWPYVPSEKAMTRFDATAMNRLCQWIVGEGAAEINYHGMKPANVDDLARAAAKVEGRPLSAVRGPAEGT